MIHYNDSDYLMHYGVLGMKWGQRRVRIHSEKAKIGRQSSREWHDIARSEKAKGKSAKTVAKDRERAAKDLAYAKKHEAKAKKIQNKHQGRAGNIAYNRVKNTSTGKLIAQSLLLGTYGSLKYHQAKSYGKSTGKSIVEGFLYGMGDNATRGLLSIVEPRVGTKKNKK